MNTPASGNGNNALDKIGDWSVDKLDILKAYSEQYSLILQKQTTTKGAALFHSGYIDGFAGAGEHIQKSTGKIVPGSPLNALNLAKKFDEYHFIDLDPERVTRLQQMCAGVKNAFVHQGDCNEVLLKNLFPKFRYEDYRRALCFLDPYGMHLNWEVLATAGKMKSVEIFLNFPIMDINRNAKKRNLADVDPDHRARMTALWGDESWHAAMYAPSAQENFLGLLAGETENSPEMEKMDNEAFVTAFQKRLKDVGGFAFVPKPVPMKNSRNAVVYYLFFASNNEPETESPVTYSRGIVNHENHHAIRRACRPLVAPGGHFPQQLRLQVTLELVAQHRDWLRSRVPILLRAQFLDEQTGGKLGALRSR